MDSFAWIVYLIENEKARLLPGLYVCCNDAAYMAHLQLEATGREMVIDCIPWGLAIGHYEGFLKRVNRDGDAIEDALEILERNYRRVGNLPPGL